MYLTFRCRGLQDAGGRESSVGGLNSLLPWLSGLGKCWAQSRCGDRARESARDSARDGTKRQHNDNGWFKELGEIVEDGGLEKK